MSPEAPPQVDAIVLGATGYAGGELLRLIAVHPRLSLAAAVSGSRAGDAVSAVFPHLQSAYPEARFSFAQDLASLPLPNRSVVVFSAAPHGASAKLVAHTLRGLQERGVEPWIVDLSADFRHDLATFEGLYGPHPEPELLAAFGTGLPDHDAAPPGRFVGEPGCFTTSVVLAAAPLVASGLFEPTIRVSAITGSTGSGRAPRDGTHHPHRQSNLWSYKALKHRHAPEMQSLLARFGEAPDVRFVPHSGPFARGIHATLFLRTHEPTSTGAVRSLLSEFYAHKPFVQVVEGAPALKDVVGTNRCHLGTVAEGHEVAVFSVIDNLLKGAAGGGVQWLNRLVGWPAELGLLSPAIPWT